MSAALDILPEVEAAASDIRAALAAHIEELIALLDVLDGDSDLEPSFGTVRDSRDDECEPDHDDEPSLGAPERHPSPYRSLSDLHPSKLDQMHWSGGSTDDREADAGDEGEPDEDGEPTLGWPNGIGKGAVTLSTTWKLQDGVLDGEAERRDRPELR